MTLAMPLAHSTQSPPNDVSACTMQLCCYTLRDELAEAAPLCARDRQTRDIHPQFARRPNGRHVRQRRLCPKESYVARCRGFAPPLARTGLRHLRWRYAGTPPFRHVTPQARAGCLRNPTQRHLPEEFGVVWRTYYRWVGVICRSSARARRWC